MLKIILTYALTAMIFIAIDLLWIGVIAKGLYQNLLKNFLSSQVNWIAVAVFYLLFIVGILIFAVYPALNKDSVTTAILLGALFGFFTYATYDLTNLATLKEWPIQVVLIDITWGAFITSIVSTAGFYIAKIIK